MQEDVLPNIERGILAYGSLIGEPGKEIEEATLRIPTFGYTNGVYRHSARAVACSPKLRDSSRGTPIGMS
jgi:hypothetical protein